MTTPFQFSVYLSNVHRLFFFFFFYAAAGSIWANRWAIVDQTGPFGFYPAFSACLVSRLNVKRKLQVHARIYYFVPRLDSNTARLAESDRAQEVCESRGGRRGLPALISLRFPTCGRKATESVPAWLVGSVA